MCSPGHGALCGDHACGAGTLLQRPPPPLCSKQDSESRRLLQKQQGAVALFHILFFFLTNSFAFSLSYFANTLTQSFLVVIAPQIFVESSDSPDQQLPFTDSHLWKLLDRHGNTIRLMVLLPEQLPGTLFNRTAGQKAAGGSDGSFEG